MTLYARSFVVLLRRGKGNAAFEAAREKPIRSPLFRARWTFSKRRITQTPKGVEEEGEEKCVHALILSLRRLSLFIEVASKTTPFYVYSPLVAIVGALVSTSLLPRPFPQSQTKNEKRLLI